MWLLFLSFESKANGDFEDQDSNSKQQTRSKQGLPNHPVGVEVLFDIHYRGVTFHAILNCSAIKHDCYLKNQVFSNHC